MCRSYAILVGTPVSRGVNQRARAEQGDVSVTLEQVLGVVLVMNALATLALVALVWRATRDLPRIRRNAEIARDFARAAHRKLEGM